MGDFLIGSQKRLGRLSSSAYLTFKVICVLLGLFLVSLYMIELSHQRKILPNPIPPFVLLSKCLRKRKWVEVNSSIMLLISENLYSWWQKTAKSTLVPPCTFSRSHVPSSDDHKIPLVTFSVQQCLFSGFLGLFCAINNCFEMSINQNEIWLSLPFLCLNSVCLFTGPDWRPDSLGVCLCLYQGFI